MIDTEHEQVAPLARATRWVPPTRGKAVHPSTLWRWHRRGIGGVKLEIVKIGSTTCTSREALARFFARCSGEEPATSTNLHHREREIAAAEARLAARG